MTKKGSALLYHEQPITSDLLLRSQNLTESIVNEIRKKNDEEFGELETVDYWAMSNQYSYATRKRKASDLFVDYRSKTRERKLKWLSQTQNQRSGQFYSLDSMINNGVIAESEWQLYKLPPGISDYPYRQIYQYKRVQRPDKSEWLSTHEQWVGLDMNGAVVTISVSDLNYYVVPPVNREPRNADGTMISPGQNVVNSKPKTASIIRTPESGEMTGEIVYLTPFTEETVMSALKLAHGSYTNPNDCSLTLMKEGETGGIGVKSIEDFLSDFDTTWDQLSRPASTFNFNLKDLKKILDDKYKEDKGKDSKEGKQDQYR